MSLCNRRQLCPVWKCISIIRLHRIASGAAYCYRSSVVYWSVCVLVTTLSPAKIAEPTQAGRKMSLPIIQYIKYREYLACGRYSQPYSADGSSNAAFHCQCCSNTANKHMHTVLIHDRLTATATILVFRVVNNLTQRPKTQSRTATWLPVLSPSESLFST